MKSFENMAGVQPCSVRELNQYIAEIVARDEILSYIQVSGEISGFKVYASSGHGYFTLKDAEAAIPCIMFSGRRKGLTFAPQDGMQVWVSGAVNVYEKRGSISFIVEKMQLAGFGSYYMQREVLKRKLYEEGLFAVEKKRPLPVRASRIGIITSLYGAALRDMVRILRLRQPGVEIVVAHSLVQGTEAAAALVKALQQMNRYRQVDVILFGRGGGSAEDLMVFDNEAVVRAVRSSKIPVIAAIGHEVDVSLSDLAADVRAATPTQAGQLAVPDDAELSNRVQACKSLLEADWQKRRRAAETQLNQTLHFMRNHIEAWVLKNRKQRLLSLYERLRQQMKQIYQSQRTILHMQTGRLEAFSPLQVLKRGYAGVLRKGETIYRVQDVQLQELLQLQLQDGNLLVRVEEKRIYEKTEI